VRALMMANFDAWVGAIRQCLDAAPLPRSVDRQALAEFVLTTMEGAVMQARTYRDVGYFDRSVAQLRRYFDALVGSAPATTAPAKRRRSATVKSLRSARTA
jgi:hypothetical protein